MKEWLSWRDGPKPCNRCGGPKPQSKGSKFCDSCRVVMASEAVQRNRDRSKAHYGGMSTDDRDARNQRRRNRGYTPEQLATKARLKRERRKLHIVRSGSTKVIRVPKIKQPVVIVAKKSVPREISEAWGRASDNSVLKRKFPTRASLLAHDWSGYESNRVS